MPSKMVTRPRHPPHLVQEIVILHRAIIIDLVMVVTALRAVKPIDNSSENLLGTPMRVKDVTKDIKQIMIHSSTGVHLVLG